MLISKTQMLWANGNAGAHTPAFCVVAQAVGGAVMLVILLPPFSVASTTIR
jgi:hypothetical protein